MDLEVTKKFLEKTLINSVARYWQHLPTETKDIIFSATTSSDFITAAAEAFQLEFHGEGRLIKDPTTINKYCVALQRLQLCDMCEIERYICVFQDYYYHIYNQIDTGYSYYLPLFFSKIPDPWGQKLIDTYQPMTADTLGKRIAHLRNKLSLWCSDAILAKATKGLRKRISLCCDSPKMPLMIGCDSQYYYGKIKRKYKKRKQYKKRKYFKQRKTNYYKKKGYRKTPKPTYRRNKKPFTKECRCYFCNQLGHYANKCPKKFDKNKKKIEIDEEIEQMINNEEFIQINDFEEITDSEESIFILTETDYSDFSETE
ncbi:hypothetical protein ACOSQ4_027149 [Xanthoceras sorbifolium]